MKTTFIISSGIFIVLGIILIGIADGQPRLTSTGAMSFCIALVMIWLSGGRDKVKNDGTA